MGPARWAGREPAACQQRIDSAYLAYGTMSILQLMCILAPDAPPHRSTENWGFSKQLYYSSQSVLSQSPSSSSLSSLISHSHLFFFSQINNDFQICIWFCFGASSFLPSRVCLGTVRRWLLDREPGKHAPSLQDVEAGGVRLWG